MRKDNRMSNAGVSHIHQGPTSGVCNTESVNAVDTGESIIMTQVVRLTAQRDSAGNFAARMAKLADRLLGPAPNSLTEMRHDSSCPGGALGQLAEMVDAIEGELDDLRIAIERLERL